jgi:cell division protein FtsL
VRADLDPVVLLSRPIDNSQVVRELDPRSHRELWALALLASLLVGGAVLYAWPHLQMRQAGRATDAMSQERDRLIEENRKLRLEKAALEDLARIERIAERDLGLVEPPPEHVLVVQSAPRPRAAIRAGETH